MSSNRITKGGIPSYSIAFNAADLAGLVYSINVRDLPAKLQTKVRKGIDNCYERGWYSDGEYELLNKRILEK